MTVPLSELWLHGGDGHLRVPPEFPLYNIRQVSPGHPIGPLTYVVDDVAMQRYAATMGVEQPLYPTVPARHTDPLRNSHEDRQLNSKCIAARMMLELFNPVQPGDVLTLKGEVVAVYERRGKPYVTVQTDTVNADGVLIDRIRKTMLLSRKDVAQKWDFIRAAAN
jgi:hypothetical protein